MEDKVEGNTHSNKREKILMNEDSLRNILDNIKHNNICIMGIPEGKENEQGIENLFEEIMTENFPNLGKEKVTQVQEAQSPKQVGPKEAYIKTYHN